MSASPLTVNKTSTVLAPWQGTQQQQHSQVLVHLASTKTTKPLKRMLPQPNCDNQIMCSEFFFFCILQSNYTTSFSLFFVKDNFHSVCYIIIYKCLCMQTYKPGLFLDLKCGPSDTYPLFFVDVILPNTCNIYDIIVCSLNSMFSGYFSVNICMKTYIFLFFSNKIILYTSCYVTFHNITFPSRSWFSGRTFAFYAIGLGWNPGGDRSKSS